MRIIRYLESTGVLAMLLCCPFALGQSAPGTAVPLINQVTPPSLAPAPNPSLVVQFTLTILGANFPPNPVVKLTLPQGPSLYAASASVNATGSQIVAQFNTTLPRPAVYAVTVSNAINNPTAVSNVFYLPITPPATTVGISQNTTQFLTGAPSAMATGDFNGDGNVDLAFVSQNTNTVSILLGTFGGTFNPGAAYPTGNLPSGIVAADFNGDGILDLAVTNSADNTITVLLGNGDGTFRPGITINDTGSNPTQIVAADLNGDGHMDLAVLNLCGPTIVSCAPQTGGPLPSSLLVLLGNGDGTFSISSSTPATGASSSALAAADLNSDGVIDLVVANQDSNMTVLMGNGDGTFTPTQSGVATGTGSWAIAIADFNGDGKLDIAVANLFSNTVSLFLNQNCGLPAAACTFSATPTSITVGRNPYAIFVGDMNADGSVDLVVANFYDDSVMVLFGDGKGGFTAADDWVQIPTFATGAEPVAIALADFNGDGRLDLATANASGSYSILIQDAVPQVVLTTGNSSPTYGMNVTFTANIIPSIGTRPTGTVTLHDGANSLGAVALSGYQANFFVSTLSAGTHQITATYSGDSNFLAAASAPVTETVSQAQTNLTVTSNVNTLPYGQPFTLSATVIISNLGSPTGAISFFDTSSSTSLGTTSITSGVAQLTLSTLSPGAHVITASYGGDANFLGSSSPAYTENITQASSTTSVTTSASPVNLGQTPTFTATVQPSASTAATGFVIFFADGSTSLGAAQVTNNSAQLRGPFLSVGPHSITAQYTGDTNYTGSTSSSILELVNPAADNVILTTGPTVYGQASTFVATVQGVNYSGTATGTMTFSDGSTVLGIAALSNGSAQFTTSGLAVGAHQISASYSGDANFQAGASAPVATNVSRANTTTVVSSGQNPSAFGQAVLLTANVQPAFGGAATGNVTFLDGPVTLGTSTLNANVAVLSVPNFTVGTHSISASYFSDSNVNGSASTPLNQTVNPSPTSVTLTSNTNPSTYGQSLTFAATVKAAFGTASASNVSFYDGTTLLGTINTATAPPQMSIATLTAGTHSITAQYVGNANFASSTSMILTQTVNQAASLIVISSSANPSTFGQTVTLNASISTTGNFTSANSGTLTFLDNGAPIRTATLPGNTNFATLTTTALTMGTHSIIASYSGDSNFAAGTSAAFTQTVNLEPTTTLISSSSSTPAFAQSITLTATVKPLSGTTATGTVTFLDGTTTIGTATLSSNIAQLAITLGPGTHYVSAQYSGDTNTAASTSGQSLVTVSPPPTTTVLSSSQNPSSLNQPVTFTATLQLTSNGNPTGSVTFYDGSQSIGTGTVVGGIAQLTISGFQVGTHSITANYSGDSNFSGSISALLSQVVNPGNTTTAVTSNYNPAIVGFNVTFTVNVVPPFGGAPTGLVTLFDGSKSLGSASVTNQNGQNYALFTLSTLTAGSHSITAAYNGSGYFAASTSAVLTQTVNLPATATYLSSSINPSIYGQAVTLVATLQPSGSGTATGTVTFFNGATSLGTATVSNNTTQLLVSTLPVGSNLLTAKYSGDTNFASSTSAAITQTVNQASTTTTVGSSPNPATFGQTVILTASVQSSSSGTPTGTVAFFDGSTSLGSASLSGSSAQLTLASLSLGSHAITAKYNGDSNYTVSSSSALTQSVTQSGSSTTLISNANPSSFGQATTFTATVQPSYSGTPTGTIGFFDGGNSLGSINLSGGSVQLTISNFSPGSHSITAKYSGDSNFAASASVPLAQNVNQAATSTTVNSNANPSSFGQIVSFTATVTPPYGGTPTGNVSFFKGGTSLGNANLAGGVAIFSTQASAFNAGSQSITAKYNGDSNFLTSTSAVFLQTVGPAATITTLSSNPNPAAVGKSVTFTAHVSSSVSGTLTGTLTFYLDGGTTPVASVSLSGGNAQYSTNSLSAGTHSLAADFASSNSNFNGSNSTSLTQSITDFTISASPASDTIARGSSGTYTLTLAPVGGLTGNVSLSCSGAPGRTSCSISPGQVTLDGINSEQTIVTVAVGTGATRGTYTLTLKGTSGSITHTTTVSLMID